MARLRSLLVALSLLSTTPFALAQTILPATLPACAIQCTNLQSAANTCETNPATQNQCFCSAPVFAPVFQNAAANICSPQCSDADWTPIAQFFLGFCANIPRTTAAAGATTSAAAAGAAGPSTSGTPATTLVTTTAGDGTPQIVEATGPPDTGSSGGGSSGGFLSGGNDSDNVTGVGQINGQQWWTNHYQWIIMLIVLLIAFTALGVGGAFLYRRHQRKKTLNRGSYAGGSAAQWAPNNSTHDFSESTDRNARAALATKPSPLAGQDVQEKHQPKGKGRLVGLLRKNTR